MKLKEIPAGHLAINLLSGNIILVGKDHSMWMSGITIFKSMATCFFDDEYEDLGELKINIETKKITKVQFEAKL